jgi:hypothetical protein
MLRHAALLLSFAVLAAPPTAVDFTGLSTRTATLAAGAVVEVYAGLPAPSQLPPNGRLAVEFAGYRKILHALDPDFHIVYRAPKAGTYTLRVSVVEDEEAIFNRPRWRESGAVALVNAFPRRTPWPRGHRVRLRMDVRPVVFGESRRGMHVEMEPNDSIAQSQPLEMGASGGDETLHITGGADDIEYFDNGLIGQAGDDWFRIDFRGAEPRLFTANLALPDPFVVAQLQCFTADGKEYRDGANENERVHQQLEGHRTAITRTFRPGGVYFLRVEANSPGYEVELRLRRPAPYTDPRQAVRQAMYDHLGQVDAWLLNRPRGASVDRRIRDTGSLLGSHCMSCHTQSGVWGPTGPVLHGYWPENVANYRHLINVMNESMRPTNELQDAANNTSLAPLDLGDGPAGTRVAGYNATVLETAVAPRQLHSMQQIRAANHVLQSNDPGGINAAGPGSNIGQALVARFTGEILKRAWEKTRDKRYFEALEQRAERILNINVRFSDDLSNRIEFFAKTFPVNYVSAKGDTDQARNLWTRGRAQVAFDERRLRQIQKADGTWGFDPGSTADGGRTWKITTTDPKDTDPAPTALALTALSALGYDDRDPAVRRGVAALLAMQDPYGRWNRNALTGFVTTAYAMHALARLYPAADPAPSRAAFEPRAGESLADTIARFRAMAQLGLRAGDEQYLDLVLPGATHASPQVRYWAQLALGALHNERGVAAQIAGLGDPAKMVREAARWGLRQTLLDDKGWDYLFPAYATGDDLTREGIAGALVMRADAVLTRSSAGFDRLTAALDRMMNRDPHPAVRAWSSRAAWNWWVWNPPVRDKLNAAVLKALDRDEPSALAENALRYQMEALFIANGQRANGSREHQYRELATLFDAIGGKLEAGASRNLRRRLVDIAGTYYNTSGGDGGPGQMGYVTAGSAEMMGKAILDYWIEAERAGDRDRVRLAVEASASVTHEPLQAKVLEYSSSGPPELRTIASTSLSDPRTTTLPGTQEFLEPLIEQIHRGALEPERREELVQPLVRLFRRARWNLPQTEEQQRIFYSLLVPKFAPERGLLEENTRVPLQMEKDSADWFLARSLGAVIHSNPDLATNMLVRSMPEKFATPMEEMLWLPSVRWLMSFGTPVPEIGAQAEPPGPVAAARERAVDLLVRTLTAEKVDQRLRGAAMSALADIHVRTHPRVAALLPRVQPNYVEGEPAEVAALSEAWRRNFRYFERWVMPELQRPNRDDELGCLGCHAVAGRVPSMELAGAAPSGFLSSSAAYRNYRILLDRVNESNVEESKLLRKPLNVQNAQEEGHQGGRRYSPADRGYQIIRTWVLDAAALKRAPAATER